MEKQVHMKLLEMGQYNIETFNQDCKVLVLDLAIQQIKRVSRREHENIWAVNKVYMRQQKKHWNIKILSLIHI